MPAFTFTFYDVHAGSWNPINSNELIILTKNDHIYNISCSTYSNPAVNLTLYDTYSMIPFSNFQTDTSFIYRGCSSLGYYSFLNVNFQFLDNKFDNMTSLTCAATSSNPLVYLSSSITKNVTVIQAGNIF